MTKTELIKYLESLPDDIGCHMTKEDENNCIDESTELFRISSAKPVFNLNPNPVCLSATVSYQLQHTSFVHVALYDLSGCLINTLVNSFQTSGIHNVSLDVSGLKPGIYLCKIQTGDYSETKKMILIK